MLKEIYSKIYLFTFEGPVTFYLRRGKRHLSTGVALDLDSEAFSPLFLTDYGVISADGFCFNGNEIRIKSENEGEEVDLSLTSKISEPNATLQLRKGNECVELYALNKDLFDVSRLLYITKELRVVVCNGVSESLGFQLDNGHIKIEDGNERSRQTKMKGDGNNGRIQI